MKKGLRPTVESDSADFAVGTADLMKKGLRLDCLLSCHDGCVGTADLMKKGLRLNVVPVPGLRELEQQT